MTFSEFKVPASQPESISKQGVNAPRVGSDRTDSQAISTRAWRFSKFEFQIVAWLIVLGLWASFPSQLLSAPQEQAPATTATPEQNLATSQQQIAEQVARLEALLLRSSDIESLDNPTRAALLQQAVALSKQAQLAETLIKASQNLSANQLSEAIESQKISRDTLKRLLELLQSENREQRVREQRDQVRRWIEETDRLLRMQSSLRGRTEGGLEADQASEDQSKLSDKASKIADDLGESLGDDAPEDGKSESQNNPAQANEKSDQGSDREQQGKSSESDPNKPDKPTDPSPDSKQSQGEPPQDGSSESRPSPGQPQQNQPSQNQGQPQEKSSEGQPSQGQQSEDQQSEGQQSEGQQSSDQQSSGQPSGQPQPQSPTERAQQRIEQAQQNMQEAMKDLENAQREGAIEKQRQAEQNLKEAIEQLEEILNQLRQEEIKRSLETLESRLRRMLDQQNKVLEETTRLHEIGGDQPDRQVLARAAALSIDQHKVGTEGERALLLLKEEGSSAAFPEALMQVNRDIASSAKRLESGDLSKITLVIQNDIVQALEEMVDAISKVRKENEDKKQQQAQQPGGAPMEPGLQPLINKLAELRLIRTLQIRVNRRTQTLSTMLDDPNDPIGQARQGDLLGQLKELSKRQESIEQVTRNVSQQGP